jgi:hypothetical protein
MGSGSRRSGIVRAAVGGMSSDGRPTVGCRQTGELLASAFAEASEGTVGPLHPEDATVLLLGEDGVALARAVESAETDLLRACIEDGLAYSGTLRRVEGSWRILFREA